MTRWTEKVAKFIVLIINTRCVLTEYISLTIISFYIISNGSIKIKYDSGMYTLDE